MYDITRDEQRVFMPRDVWILEDEQKTRIPANEGVNGDSEAHLRKCMLTLPKVSCAKGDAECTARHP